MQITIVDAFTDTPFRGNPAATAIVPVFPADARMQLIAREMNHSETAFAVKLANNRFHLRWFTPTREVPMCGHATLAMAHALREHHAVDTTQPLVFVTLSGELIVHFRDDSLVMDFPATLPPPDGQDALVREILGDRLHAYLGSVPMNSTAVLRTQQDVADFVPDLEKISQLPSACFCITAQADPGQDADIVARVFGPQSGIDEDPVTGSAYCTLAPYWAQHLGKVTMRARQLSARGGELVVTHAGDRVLLQGHAVSTLVGRIVV